MSWWGWMILGAALLAAELVAVDAQFYLVFLGLSAIIVGLASLFGVVLPEWAQWLGFAILSLLFFVSFRGALYRRIRGGAPGLDDTITGASITLRDALPPGGDARAEYRGSEWSVRNVGDSPIPAGARGKVVRVQGLTLHIESE